MDTINTVLLTGSMGFLGRFQALAWLECLAATGGRLILIARGANTEQARLRVEEGPQRDAALLAHFRKLADGHLEVVRVISACPIWASMWRTGRALQEASISLFTPPRM